MLHIENETGKVRPFLRWAGGKTYQLRQIRTKYPTGLGITVRKYAEPFLGGGAVLFDILCRYPMDEVYISDINRELIHTYLTIRDDVEILIEMLETIEEEYLTASPETRKALYSEKRRHYNLLKKASDRDTELAALFIFLNSTCFSGLYRVNSSGEFNTSFGNRPKPIICDPQNLRTASQMLQGVTIISGDYRLSASFIDSSTLCYFDPPYRPLPGKECFTAYDASRFGDSEQTELARYINEMSKRGAYIIASNSDPRNTDENDDFFDSLYQGFTISRVDSLSTISRKGISRRRLSELLICNTPKGGDAA